MFIKMTFISFHNYVWTTNFDTHGPIIPYQRNLGQLYRIQYELISKFNVGLKTLLREGLSEPEFYGDLIYKF